MSERITDERLKDLIQLHDLKGSRAFASMRPPSSNEVSVDTAEGLRELQQRRSMTTIQIIANGELPQRKSPLAAGYDLYCAGEPALITNRDATLVRTGVRLDMSGTGLAAQLFLRSSLIKRDIILANGVGLIDEDYQGEIMVALRWLGEGKWTVIEPGERIAQLVFFRPEYVTFERVTEFKPTERGSGGFGSTG